MVPRCLRWCRRDGGDDSSSGDGTLPGRTARTGPGHDGRATSSPLRPDARPRAAHRAAGLDAGRLPVDDDPPDRPARALGDHRHAAGGQLDHPGSLAAPQGDPHRQGARRGRPRHVPVLGGRDARRRSRRPHRQARARAAEVLLDLQLPDADLRRRRRDRLAGRRRGHLQPGAAVPLLLRSLRPGHGAHLQGGVVPPAAGLRAADDDDARHRRRSARWCRTRRTGSGGRR